MKLTAEVVQGSPQYFNPAKQWTLNLRNYKVNMIENLGVTLNQFECIDLSDNDIRKVDGFPLLDRLKALVLCNNRICRIDDRLHESLPNLTSVNLINNLFEELGDLDALKSLTKLSHLYLMRNPVAARKNYREYLIYLLPQLRVLDNRRVSPKERDSARKLFKSKTGKQLLEELGFRSGAGRASASKSGIAGRNSDASASAPAHSHEDIENIKAAINSATSLEEIERLNALLSSGHIPTTFKKPFLNAAGNANGYGSSMDFVPEEDDEQVIHNAN